MAQNNTVQYTITAKDQASAVFAQVAQKAKGTSANIGEAFLAVGATAYAMRGVVSDGFKVMTGDFSKLGSLLGSLPGPIGMVGQAVGNTLGKMLQDTVDAAEGFRKLSERTGASVEFLSGFTEAADDVFVKSESVSAALGIFAKKLGGAEDAMDGSGVSAGVFAEKLREIGINTDNVEDALLTVADRFKDMKDGTEKTALAVQLFGKQGAELIPILNKGRDGIAEMSAAAKEMGLVMTDETIEAVKEMKRNQDELNDTVEGFARRLASGVIPELNKFTKALNASGDSVDDFAGNALVAGKANFDKYNASVKAAGMATREFGEWNLQAAPAASAFIGIVGQGGDAFAEIAERMVTTNGAIIGFTGAIQGATPPTQAMKDAAQGVNSAVGEMPIKMDAAQKATLIFKLATGQMAFETFKAETATRAVTKALMDGKITTEEAAALYQGLADKSIKTEDALKRTGQAGKDAAALIDAMNAAMGRVQSKDVSLTFQAFRTPEYSGALGQWESIQSKSVTVSFNTVGGTNVESDNGSNRRAKGGPVKKGKPYIVGEQGQEMFVPYTAGYIVPNNAMPYTDPGTKVAQSFNVNNPSIIIQSTQGAAIAQQIARQNANVARRARARASLMG